ncbi:hypothetical protein C0Q70_09346 [Pomacea canaliculata]|uniref:TROVE domain-containing protein n=1 Tax=Pomacea canaliculata TaxID=400727 RepID=A0A2T7P9I6_POMCA|nr:hypothetical protein C0Q70_09346 [Pomacea canaliculata]
MSKEKDLLGTHNSLLTKWSEGGGSLNLKSNLLTSGFSSKITDGEVSRKLIMNPFLTARNVKNTKDEQSNLSFLSAKQVTSGPSLLVSSSTLSALSSTKHEINLKLKSPYLSLHSPMQLTSHISPGQLGVSSSHGPTMKYAGSSAAKREKQNSAVKSPKKEDSARCKLGISKKKKIKVQREIDDDETAALMKYTTQLPEYGLFSDTVDDVEMKIPAFIYPTQDSELVTSMSQPIVNLNGLKNGLINAVSASLLCSPNFHNLRDQARQQLLIMSESIIWYDPEFVLKVALYSRRELNIRTTSNFLLALASNYLECRPYLRKYYSSTIMLPSDWIEVAEMYQVFGDKKLNFGALPAALRKVMTVKFLDFDKYQLAKYNKEKSRLKKNKKSESKEKSASQDAGQDKGRGGKLIKAGTKRSGDKIKSHSDDDTDNDDDGDDGSDGENPAFKRVRGVKYDEESETKEEQERKTFTLKQLIRKLHIVEPPEHVMCLVGKKYPKTPEEFYCSRLPGVWEEERAGKRMKLPIPETWETQVSLKGNKAKTWEDLLDHKKLPFMAMLRNLRNLIKAGISDKHHNMVIRRLTNEKQVINSKQFPFRFFSAYEVLNTMEKEFDKTQKAIIDEAVAATRESGASKFQGHMKRGRGSRGTRGKGRGRGGAAPQWWQKKLQKKASSGTKETMYDKALLQRYRKALDTAVKIATVYNVQPIKGRTVIICSMDPRTQTPCSAARGLGKPRTVREVSLLLALMCKYSCEESELVLHDGESCCSVQLQKGTILDNLQHLLNTSISQMSSAEPLQTWDDRKKKEMVHNFPYWVLFEKLRDKIQVDNIVVLGFDLNPSAVVGTMIGDFLRPYRRLVNPNLLYVSICTSGSGCKFDTDITPEHENDIYISGFSDAILRFVAERGSGGQLIHVENIDKIFGLKESTPLFLESVKKEVPVGSPEKPLPVSSLTPRWRTARVFISSTFLDMHGERDLLTRFVFPELRARGSHHFINIFEVDLRWGITEEDARNNRTVELCLQELKKCQLFVGLLGNRYGWVPAPSQLPDTPEYDCVREYEAGASVTELEIHFGALADVEKTKERAFFFIRDSSFEKNVPSAFLQSFASEDEESMIRLNNLKNRVRCSGHEVFDNYPCQWGGVVDKKPIVAGLEEFGQRALNNLWLAVQHLYPDEDAMLDEDTHIARLHRAFVDSRSGQFVGRTALVQQCVNRIAKTSSCLIGLVGKSGSGKSSVMASIIHQYVESKHCSSGSTVLVHIVGAAPGSTNLGATICRLSQEIIKNFGLSLTVPEDFKNQVVVFGSILQEAGRLCGPSSRLVLFLDGLYLMEDVHKPCNLEWLPHPLPPNVVVVVSAVESDQCHQAVERLKGDVVSVGPLDMFDKAEIIRKTLATHRKALNEAPFNNQLKVLTMKKEAHNPLFLKLACEELRVFGLFDDMASRLKSMPHTTPQLLQEVLVRMEGDHGVDIVSITLCLLLCSRDGLFPEELQDLLAWHVSLAKNFDKFHPYDMIGQTFPAAAALPCATFAFLQRSIQSFLNPLNSYSGNVQLMLAHHDIGVAIRQRYLRASTNDKERQLHRLLAGYYMLQADPSGDRSWQSRNTRAFSKLPYHLCHGSCYEELEDVLCSLQFIHTKCKLGLAAQLMEDFAAKGSNSKSQEKEKQKFLSSTRVQDYQAFVSTNLHILNRHPVLTWQQAENALEDSQVCKEVKVLQAAGTIKEECTSVKWKNKPASASPCYLHLANLSKPVTSVAVSPDSAYFATGGWDCLVHLYDMVTGKEIRFYHGHSDFITDVCFVSNAILCSASQDLTLSLWDVQNGHRVALLKGHTRCVSACVADCTGNLVASASWDCTVRVWNVKSGEEICSFSLECPVNDVDFHPDSQLIVTANWDTTIKIYDIFHKTRKAVLRGHISSVRSVAYSHDGSHVASASLDGEVKIWSAIKGVQVGSVHGHGAPINKLTFSPTGQYLITASDDHKVKVWSGDLGIPLGILGSTKNGPATSVSLSPDGTAVAVGYHSSYVRVFDVTTGLCLWEAKPHSKAVRAVTFSHDSAHVVTGSDDTTVQVLDATSGNKICSIESHTKPVLSVTVHRKFLATASEDCTCCLFSFKPVKSTGPVKPLAVLQGHTAPVTSCTFGPGATKLATASRDMSVKIWDLMVCQMDSSPAPECTLTRCHADWINACSWSNVSDFMVTASSDFNLKVWDLKTQQEKFKLTGHTSSVNAMAYKFGCIVSGSSDGQVKVWSHRGTEITTLYGHTQRVNACDIFVKCSGFDDKEKEREEEKSWVQMMQEEETGGSTADASSTKKKGQNITDVILVSCSDDGTVRLWKPLEAYSVACLSGHSKKVVAVAADKQGHLVSASLDLSVRLWAPQLATKSSVSQSHETEVTCISPSLNRCTVLTTDRSGGVCIWQHTAAAGFFCVHSFKVGSRLKKDKCEISAPVTSLIWDPALMSVPYAFVFGTSWENRLFCWLPEMQQPSSLLFFYDSDTSNEKSDMKMKSFSCWPLSLSSYGNHLIATSTDGQVTTWSVAVQNKIQDVTLLSRFTIPGDTSSSPNWVHAAAWAGTSNSVCVGDSNGCLTYLDSSGSSQQLKAGK